MTEVRERKSRIFAQHVDHHYPEPFGVSLAAVKALNLPPDAFIHDPACGWGRIPNAAAATMHINALGTDIEPRWEQSPDGIPLGGPVPHFMTHDFLHAENYLWRKPEAIISNPPYKLAEAFLHKALSVTDRYVAFILRLAFLASVKRAPMLRKTPLRDVKVIVPRPSMPTGDALLNGCKAQGGTEDYALFIWDKLYEGAPQVSWLEWKI